jgi:hypothetical protein
MPRKVKRDKKGFFRHIDYTWKQIADLRNTDTILFGIAKGPWALEWANREEEKGRSFSGQDIYKLAPDPPSEAVAWAEDIAAQLMRLNRATRLFVLYALASREGFDKSPETFGMYLGCQAAGHGISWCDDLQPGTEKLIDIPHREFHV